MTDFLFSARRQPPGRLSAALRPIYPREVVPVEWHGSWGSLAATPSSYLGLDPLETEQHVCVVVGGPVFHFASNDFLNGGDRTAGTRALLGRFLGRGMDWLEDLSGPFTVLVVDKVSGVTTCVTDMMLALPLYRHEGGGELLVGTHVDAVARASGLQQSLDAASVADFVLHYAVTYPYTVYDGVRQCAPATVYRVVPAESGRLIGDPPYWRPDEVNPYRSVAEAGEALHEGVAQDVLRVTDSMHRVAQFLSGGEDSRVLAGVIPARLQRDAFIFLDRMTREGRIAARVAAAHGAVLEPDFRVPLHYLNILRPASALVGSGHQYIHAHTLLDVRRPLDRYPAVFGGYGANSLYKALFVRKAAINYKHHFLPEVEKRGETRSRPVSNPLFAQAVLDEVTERRREHLRRVEALRPASAHEWFELWPLTMQLTVPNLYANRRLFASYEPFFANQAVKVAASVPVRWKLNRRLFHRAFRRELARTRWIPTIHGRLPAFPWWVNVPVQVAVLRYRKLERRLGRADDVSNTWYDWEAIQASDAWKQTIEAASRTAHRFPVLDEAVRKGALTGDALHLYQKVNFIQTCVLAEDGSTGDEPSVRGGEVGSAHGGAV